MFCNNLIIIFLLLLYAVTVPTVNASEKVLSANTGTGSSAEKGPRSPQDSQYFNSLKNNAEDIFQFMQDISDTSQSGNDPSNTPTPQLGDNAPTPTESPSDSWTTDITDQGKFSQKEINTAKSCLKNQAVYRRVEQETGLAWQMVAGVHLVEGSCGSTASCYSGRIFGELEPDMGNNCTKHARKVAGGCVFDNLLNSCLDGAVHFIDKIGKVPRTLPQFAEAARGYNGIYNDNCYPGNSPYSWCPAAFKGADHTHPMSWFNGDLICKQNPNAQYCLYKIYCYDGEKCAFGTPQERLGSVTVAKILGLEL